ncbi:MAG: GHKL domain-containing protein, partial [Lachnospiraceae bacterium]|nr:GHKL domain-containing protein [Lachnospiraceae bacterium]
SQAAGEYEERFAQKNLEVILSNPEKEMYISADSRKLWRVFDNLLQNIYKYAHPDTRVFLSTNEKGEKVEIIFRNTSDEIISVSADELTERFTRGDESRHKEGNGLGLAIAKSMIDLQGGEFNISVDGDLFKVTLLLNKYAEPETKLSASP